MVVKLAHPILPESDKLVAAASDPDTVTWRTTVFEPVEEKAA